MDNIAPRKITGSYIRVVRCSLFVKIVDGWWLIVVIFWISNYELWITLFFLWLSPYSFCHSERSEESVLKLMVDGWRFTVHVSRFTVDVLISFEFQITNYELRFFSFDFPLTPFVIPNEVRNLCWSWWLMVDGSRFTVNGCSFFGKVVDSCWLMVDG